MHSFFFIALLATSIRAQSEKVGYSIGQSVKTTSGEVTGKPSSWKNQVSEYLGVPFAQPPIGNLRWEAPRDLRTPGIARNATQYGFSCSESTSWKARADPNSPNNVGQSENEQSEDCLTLNIWSKPQTGEKKKAVMIWIYGGGFVVGSAANQAYNGALLADEHDVVVVGINYRLGVLGFPGVEVNPYSRHRNLGLLDQRLAIEWVRDNIENFGGDKRRIILFGQSAGGMSVDTYAYAYRLDPIVSGLIPQSGSLAELPTSTKGADISATKKIGWAVLSAALKCGNYSDANAAQSYNSKNINCMKAKSTDDILKASLTVAPTLLKKLPASSAASTSLGPFGLAYDDETFFADTPKRRQEGRFIHVPMLIGNVNNEGVSGNPSLLPSNPAAKIRNCGSHIPAAAWRKQGVPAWRYLYEGEFANNALTAPKYRNITGAWHGSEIALIFGTTELKNKGADTPNEKKLSKAIQQAWTTFAKDPVNGLRKLGWPMYSEDQNKANVVVLGSGGKDSSEIKFIPSAIIGPNCVAK